MAQYVVHLGISPSEYKALTLREKIAITNESAKRI